MKWLNRIGSVFRGLAPALLLVAPAVPGLAQAEGSVAAAIDGVRQLREATAEQWTTAEGLPQNAVISMARTSDGYLWLGTQAGLARFDGRRFTTYDRTNTLVRDDFVTALAADGNALWVGTRSGLYRLEAGSWSSIHQPSAWPDVYVRSLLVLGDRLWIGTSRAGVGWIDRHAHSAEDVAFRRVGSLYSGTARAMVAFGESLFVGMPTGVFEVDPESPSPSAERILDTDGVRALANGERLWVGTESGRIFRSTAAAGASDSQMLLEEIDALNAGSSVSVLHEDRFGKLWVGTNGRGLRLIEESGASASAEALPELIYSLAPGRDGSFWAGTRKGLFRLTRARAVSFGPEHGLPGEFVRSLWREADGSLLVVTGSGLARFDPGSERGRVLREFGDSVGLRTALRDARGILWVGSTDGLSAFRNGRRLPLSGAPSLINQSINVLATDEAGRLWVGGRSGLALFDGSSWRGWGRAEGLPHSAVRSLLPRADEVWIGTEGGLARLIGVNTENETITDEGAESLAGDLVLSLFADSQGWLWAGTASTGLFGHQGDRYVHLDRSSGLEEDVILQVVEDDVGHLWFCGNRGLGRLTRPRIDAFALDASKPVVVDRLSKRDGLPSAECNGGAQPGPVVEPGALWLPTVGGLLRVSTEVRSRPHEQPPVILETFVADSVVHQPSPGMRLGPGRVNVQLGWSAPAATRPDELHFRYRLLGLSDEWVAAGRQDQALFLGLRPGEYAFQVQASTSPTEWPQAVESISFAVRPSFFEDLRVRVLGIVLSLALIAGLYQLRTWNLRRSQERLEQLVDQRTTELAHANRRLLMAATHDELTGLPNRGRAYDRLAREWRRAQRADGWLSVLMIDLDRFKAFNDSRGHQAGDEVLREVSEVFRATFRRSTDLVGRYGGEEFIGVLAETDRDRALRMARRLVEAVRDLGARTGTDLTISVGVATVKPREEGSQDLDADVDELVRRADEALYRVKRTGGDDASA